MSKLELLRDFIRPMANACLIGFILLAALLSGIMEAISPGLGVRFTLGIGGMLSSIPTEFYTLAGAGLVTYTAAREFGKWRTARVDDPDENGPRAGGEP